MEDTARLHEVIRRYLAGESAPELGRSFTVSDQTIYRWLSDADIPRRSYAKAQTLRAAKQGDRTVLRPSAGALTQAYLHEQQSTLVIAQRWGVSSWTVNRWLKEAGIPRRSQKKASWLRMVQGRATPGRPLAAAHREAFREGLRKWEQEHPEQRAANRQKGQQRAALLNDHRAAVPCGWCGGSVLRQRCQRLRYSRSYCNNSHRMKAVQWRRWQHGTPRPLILAALREGSAARSIGALEPELRAYRAELERADLDQRAADLPAAIEPQRAAGLPDTQPPEARRKERALTAAAVGSVGEALLRAAREKQAS